MTSYATAEAIPPAPAGEHARACGKAILYILFIPSKSHARAAPACRAGTRKRIWCNTRGVGALNGCDMGRDG